MCERVAKTIVSKSHQRSLLEESFADKVRCMGKSFTNGDSANLSRHRSTVATLLYIEAAIVFALAVWLVTLGFTHDQKEIAPLVGVIVFALLGAGGLFASGRGYKNGKNYGRSPAILANLIALGVAYFQIQGHFYLGAVVILPLALPIIYFAFSIAKNENS
jgi:ABC-type transport system involved in cytochrome c biogenesis permease component